MSTAFSWLPFAAAVALLCASPAFAAILHVTSEAEGPGSLGQTILEAGPGDTIAIPSGTYVLENGDTMIAQHNILRGAGVTKTTVIPSGGGEALNQISYSGLTIAPALQTGGDDGSQIETKAQIIALLVTLAFFALILDLVRRRRPVPLDDSPDPSEGRPVAPGATVSGAGGEPEAR